MIFWFYLQLLRIVDTQLKITNSVSVYNLGDNSIPANISLHLLFYLLWDAFY